MSNVKDWTIDGHDIEVRYRRTDGGTYCPCIDVKVRKAFEDLTPEEWQAIRSDCEAGEDFDADYIEAMPFEDRMSYWLDACERGLEDARVAAETYFGVLGKRAVSLEGRNGGWLCIEGLPEGDAECIEDDDPNGTIILEWTSLQWAKLNLPSFASLKAQRGDETVTQYLGARGERDTLLNRWRMFEAEAERAVADIPYQAACMIALNYYQAKREEAAKAKAATVAQIRLEREAEFGRYVLGLYTDGKKRIEEDIAGLIEAKAEESGLLSIAGGGNADAR